MAVGISPCFASCIFFDANSFSLNFALVNLVGLESLPVLKEIATSKNFAYIQAGLGKLNFVVEWLFLFPATERRVREQTENTVLRHFLLVTGRRFSWQSFDHALEYRIKVFSQRGKAWSFYRLLGFYAFVLLGAFTFGSLFSYPSLKPLAVLFFVLWTTAIILSKHERRAELDRLVRLLDEIRRAPMDKLPIQ
ncbi:MAG: hypothetical protein NZ805_09825 [Armatimonadetes bacterium]|nr:hypothetical protein [Armatimonadota bacterium]MDW8028934.1 hypothetical protein [Armatimonadota bacterium]